MGPWSRGKYRASGCSVFVGVGLETLWKGVEILTSVNVLLDNVLGRFDLERGSGQSTTHTAVYRLSVMDVAYKL
jgi:hypothetical protein